MSRQARRGAVLATVVAAAAVSVVAAPLAAVAAPAQPGVVFADRAAGRVRAQRPSYLAQLDRIDKPITPGGVYLIRPLAAVAPAQGEDPTKALVDQFLRQCLTRALRETDPGPDIDVHVLDPMRTPRGDGAVPVVRGGVFCVPQQGADLADVKAMASRLAGMPAMLTPDNSYVPREPYWCGGMGLLPDEARQSGDLAIAALGGVEPDRAGRHCWAAARVADYDRALAALRRELVKRRLRFEPEPRVKDGSILRQAALVQRDRKVSRTILVSGRRNKALNGPDIELHVFLGRFAAPDQ